MRKLLCVLLAAVLILGSVPSWAAENRVNLTGKWIYIDENTESTVWVDQNGGTLVWDKEANTLTFNSFNYDIETKRENYGTGLWIGVECSVILNETNVITSSAKVICTMGFNDVAISGDGKLTVYGPHLEPEDIEKLFSTYNYPYSSAIKGSFTLNSGTLEGIGGTMKCDNSAGILDWVNSSSAYGVYGNGFDTIRINGGELIAKGGTTMGRKYYNECIGVCAARGENNEGLVIAGGRVTASGKDYGTSGKLAFPQYSEGILYAVGEKSGIDCETIDEEVIAYGSPELNADENSVTGTLSRVCTSVRLSDDESSENFKNFYEYTTGNVPAKTVVVRRNNERKVAITDSGAELAAEKDSTAAFGLNTKNIKAEEIPQIEWTKDMPSGISASFADEKLIFKTDGTTKRGVYPFKLAFGEGEKRVVSEKAALSVGSYAAKIICKNKPDEYFDTFSDAHNAAELSENAGCTLMLFALVSSDGEITLDGDFTLDLNGFDIACSALVMQNGAGVWGKGNIPVGKIGAGGRVGGGAYGNLSVTDGKTICDHLTEDTFCIQKDDRNDENKYWYELSAVQSMANVVVRPVSFKTDPVADVEAKVGEEIKVPINFHETPYYEKSAYNIEGFIIINEDGSETKLDYGCMSNDFTKLDTTMNPWERYPVKDKTTTATLKYTMFPGTGAYKVYAVLSAYLDKKEVDYAGGTDTLLVEKYVTKTEPFEIRIGISRPGYLMPEPAVDPDGNVVIAWNIYSQYTYTGAPQQLVHSVPQIFNGVMMYRFGEDDVWTDEIPTATEPGVYTFQNYIKGNDGYMDIPMDDGRAVINSAVLADDSAASDGKYYVHFSDALNEAQKEENAGKLLKLYYADKYGFALNREAKIKLGLEYGATVGDIALGGTAQLTAEYGTLGSSISVDEGASLRVNDGTVNKINLSGSAHLSVSGGTVKNLTVNGGSTQITGGTFENITVLNGKTVGDLLDGYALQGADGTLVNMYTDKIAQTVSVVEHTHNLGGIGTCACGYEEKAVDSDNDGAVEICTAKQLQWFAHQINGGKTLDAVLANDIDLNGESVIIGTKANPFKGKFDGKGAKITNYALTVSGNKQGLFGVVSGGEVRDFTVSGTITVNNVYTNIGGAVGNAKGGALISGIVSDVNISGSGAAKHVGGVLGSSEGLGGTLTVEKCIYNGTVNLPNVSDCLGGVVGYANEFVTISHCGFIGSVTGQKGGYVGGILGYINNADFGGLKNSFAAGCTNGAALIGTVRDCSDTVRNCVYEKGVTPFGGANADKHTAEAVTEWNTGRVAYLLNDGKYDGLWKQTIGTDAYPNFEGKTVYRSSKTGYSNEKKPFIVADGENVEIYNISQACILIAVSRKGATLVDVNTKDITADTTVTLTELGLNGDDADKISFMIWNSLDKMLPLCEVQ